jgi:hypothetical protein
LEREQRQAAMFSDPRSTTSYASQLLAAAQWRYFKAGAGRAESKFVGEKDGDTNKTAAAASRALQRLYRVAIRAEVAGTARGLAPLRLRTDEEWAASRETSAPSTLGRRTRIAAALKDDPAGADVYALGSGHTLEGAEITRCWRRVGFGKPVLPEAADTKLGSATLRRHLAHITLTGMLEPHVPEAHGECHTLLNASLAAELRSRLAAVAVADTDDRHWVSQLVADDGYLPPDVSPR